MPPVAEALLFFTIFIKNIPLPHFIGGVMVIALIAVIVVALVVVFEIVRVKDKEINNLHSKLREKEQELKNEQQKLYDLTHPQDEKEAK